MYAPIVGARAARIVIPNTPRMPSVLVKKDMSGIRGL